MRVTTKVIKTRIKPLVHLFALLPFLLLLYRLLNQSLGANPIESLTHSTGQWGLRFLLLTLGVSPLVKITGLKWLMQLRRMLGLYSAFYVLLHFLIYLVFDQSLSLDYVLEDIGEHPYITAGFFGFLLLIPLAATSPLAVRRRMGRRWNQLHRLTYAVGVLGIIHLLWLTKADFGQVWIYSIIFLILMLFRLPVRAGKRFLNAVTSQ
ncbi:MAG: sulfoxide reductase heme-binding subunit YedZ [Exilibacterium sp.]